MNININSEIGRLEGVILHTPGPEIEQMTPETTHHALYSDLLNLNIAQKEYSYFEEYCLHGVRHIRLRICLHRFWKMKLQELNF